MFPSSSKNYGRGYTLSGNIDCSEPYTPNGNIYSDMCAVSAIYNNNVSHILIKQDENTMLHVVQQITEPLVTHDARGSSTDIILDGTNYMYAYSGNRILLNDFLKRSINENRSVYRRNINFSKLVEVIEVSHNLGVATEHTLQYIDGYSEFRGNKRFENMTMGEMYIIGRTKTFSRSDIIKIIHLLKTNFNLLESVIGTLKFCENKSPSHLKVSYKYRIITKGCKQFAEFNDFKINPQINEIVDFLNKNMKPESDITTRLVEFNKNILNCRRIKRQRVSNNDDKEKDDDVNNEQYNCKDDFDFYN